MTSSTDPTLLLRMLEPAVRPGASGLSGSTGAAPANRDAGATSTGPGAPAEGPAPPSFAQLLRSVGAPEGVGPAGVPAAPSAPEAPGSNGGSLNTPDPAANPLPGLPAPDNADVLRLIAQRAGATPSS
ncbi:MAG: hypothetical protein AAF612_05355 [Planctomycetota bacterium]